MQNKTTIRNLVIAIIAITSLAMFMAGCRKQQQPRPLLNPIVQTSRSQPFVGRVKYVDSISIRMIILKHCPDEIANIDGSQAIQALEIASAKGLTIEDIGNFHINKEGKTHGLSWSQKFSYDDLSGLKRFISDQMKVNAEYGDTMMVYTIGHGSGGGSLMRLGQREGVMRIIAEAAEENEQETLWWQLSCHAAAKLPPISSLTPRQQELFSMTASSPANKLSYFNTQGAQLKVVFTALAEKSEEIDPNRDEVITAGELKNFMIKKFGRERGELVFAKNDNEPIFGLLGGLANTIPIRDRNNPQGEYERNYIPFPRR